MNYSIPTGGSEQQNDQSFDECLEFSLGCSGPDYTKDVFFASIEQHLESVVPPKGSYPQLTEDARTLSSKSRKSLKSSCTVEERHARALEKNRQAQKRFRDKQKSKVCQLEQQMDKLNQKIQQLEIVNQELQDQLEQSKQGAATLSGSQSTHVEAIDQAADTEELRKVEGKYHMKSINREISSEMIRNLHVPEVRNYLMQTFALMINEISKRVIEADDPFADRSKLEKLEQVVEDERACMVRMFVINPAASLAMHGDGVEQSVDYLESKIKLTVQKLQLTDTQKSVITFLWRRFLELQTDCMTQRTEIATQLTEADARSTTQREYYKQFTRTHELVFRVRENWRQDYKNHWDLMSTIALYILTPLQFGRMVFYMAPDMMDFFTLCKLVSGELDNNSATGNEQFSAQNVQQVNGQTTANKDLFVFGRQPSLDLSDLLNSQSDFGAVDSANEVGVSFSLINESQQQDFSSDASDWIRKSNINFD
eukprot:TRINITY_DN4503_c0_g1_i2.p1 TRINITY_DN4503_c0_g1~~TRINITY_DN4503_c0_g1_i2.p1  ORF type:complete len:492 (-),score=64.25 TRINITY_DN4503_c0_g1_i2:264-1709(-)